MAATYNWNSYRAYTAKGDMIDPNSKSYTKTASLKPIETNVADEKYNKIELLVKDKNENRMNDDDENILSYSDGHKYQTEIRPLIEEKVKKILKTISYNQSSEQNINWTSDKKEVISFKLPNIIEKEKQTKKVALSKVCSHLREVMDKLICNVKNTLEKEVLDLGGEKYLNKKVIDEEQSNKNMKIVCSYLENKCRKFINNQKIIDKKEINSLPEEKKSEIKSILKNSVTQIKTTDVASDHSLSHKSSCNIFKDILKKFAQNTVSIYSNKLEDSKEKKESDNMIENKNISTNDIETNSPILQLIAKDKLYKLYQFVTGKGVSVSERKTLIDPESLKDISELLHSDMKLKNYKDKINIEQTLSRPLFRPQVKSASLFHASQDCKQENDSLRRSYTTDNANIQLSTKRDNEFIQSTFKTRVKVSRKMRRNNKDNLDDNREKIISKSSIDLDLNPDSYLKSLSNQNMLLYKMFVGNLENHSHFSSQINSNLEKETKFNYQKNCNLEAMTIVKRLVNNVTTKMKSSQYFPDSTSNVNETDKINDISNAREDMVLLSKVPIQWKIDWNKSRSENALDTEGFTVAIPTKNIHPLTNDYYSKIKYKIPKASATKINEILSLKEAINSKANALNNKHITQTIKALTQLPNSNLKDKEHSIIPQQSCCEDNCKEKNKDGKKISFPILHKSKTHILDYSSNMAITMLSAIAMDDYVECANLLRQGFDINLSLRVICDTPFYFEQIYLPVLHIAALFRRPKLIRLFLQNGANPNLRTDRWFMPIHLILDCQRYYYFFACQFFDILPSVYSNRKIYDLKTCTEEMDVIPSLNALLHPEDDSNETYKSNKKLLLILNNNKADINITDKTGRTVLHNICLQYKDEPSSYKVIRYLLKNGSRVNARDAYGNTPLIYALQWKNSSIVTDILFSFGAIAYNPTSKNIYLSRIEAIA